MLPDSTIGWSILLLSIGMAALVIYFVIYPVEVLAFLSPLVYSKPKRMDQVLAMPGGPKIKIEFNGNSKSKLIIKMKQFLENLADDNPEVYSMATDPDKRDQSFIPEDDEENPDLEINETDGPEINEKDAPDDDSDEPSDHVRLGDL